MELSDDYKKKMADDKVLSGINKNTLTLIVQVVALCAFFFTMQNDVKANAKDVIDNGTQLADHELRIRKVEAAVMDIGHLQDDVSEIKELAQKYIMEK